MPGMSRHISRNAMYGDTNNNSNNNNNNIFSSTFLTSQQFSRF